MEPRMIWLAVLLTMIFLAACWLLWTFGED